MDAVVAGGRTKSGGTPLVVEPGRPAAVDLVVHRVGTQEIEVVDGAGEPVADVPVELVRQGSGAEPTLQMRVLDPFNARMEPTTSLSLEQVSSWRDDIVRPDEAWKIRPENKIVDTRGSKFAHLFDQATRERIRHKLTDTAAIPSG